MYYVVNWGYSSNNYGYTDLHYKFTLDDKVIEINNGNIDSLRNIKLCKILGITGIKSARKIIALP